MSSDPLDLDWSAVDHAYGPATDLPGVLRALRTPDEQRRAAAARQFRLQALHQDSPYPAAVAAVPYLIELLADDSAPDRTLGHELLTAILPEEQTDHHAYEAVRAGVPTYLRLLGNPDRDARGLGAHLLSYFPETAPQATPVIAARLAVEQDRVVASFLCLTAGMIGGPALLPAVTRWRDQPGRVIRWTVLMGLARLTQAPDTDMLEQLCDCLFHGPMEVHGWPFHHESPPLGAALALSDLPVSSAPGLATMLIERLAAGGEDLNRFYYAARLLLSQASPPRAAIDVIRNSGAAGHPSIARLLQECDPAR
ncbi:hypothetical protein ACFY36_11875 [Actinoplanes sp. NPDC000266]